MNKKIKYFVALFLVANLTLVQSTVAFASERVDIERQDTKQDTKQEKQENINKEASQNADETSNQPSTKPKEVNQEDAIKEVKDKWNALSVKQKNKIYNLLEERLEDDIDLLDQLVSYGLMSKEEAEQVKTHMQEEAKQIKESGEFPLLSPSQKRGNNK